MHFVRQTLLSHLNVNILRAALAGQLCTLDTVSIHKADKHVWL